jgi:UDP-glucose 6-dehydrogenase
MKFRCSVGTWQRFGASIAAEGQTVSGVDGQCATKVASLNEGRSPIVEKGLDELIRDNTANGRCARRRARRTRSATPTSRCICVGTPSRKNGSLDLTYLERVAEQIGEALKDKDATTSSSSAAPCCRDDARRGDPGAGADVGQEVRDAASA